MSVAVSPATVSEGWHFGEVLVISEENGKIAMQNFQFTILLRGKNLEEWLIWEGKMLKRPLIRLMRHSKCGRT